MLENLTSGPEQPAMDNGDERVMNDVAAMIVTALNLDIAQIALIHARVALNLLLANEPDLIGLPQEVNLIVFANRREPSHFPRPFYGEFFHIERQADCLVCGAQAGNVEAEAAQILRSLDTGD